MVDHQRAAAAAAGDSSGEGCEGYRCGPAVRAIHAPLLGGGDEENYFVITSTGIQGNGAGRVDVRLRTRKDHPHTDDGGGQRRLDGRQDIPLRCRRAVLLSRHSRVCLFQPCGTG